MEMLAHHGIKGQKWGVLNPGVTNQMSEAEYQHMYYLLNRKLKPEYRLTYQQAVDAANMMKLRADIQKEYLIAHINYKDAERRGDDDIKYFLEYEDVDRRGRELTTKLAETSGIGTRQAVEVMRTLGNIIHKSEQFQSSLPSDVRESEINKKGLAQHYDDTVYHSDKKLTDVEINVITGYLICS